MAFLPFQGKASRCWAWFAATVLQERGATWQHQHLDMSFIRTGASGFIKDDAATSFICFAATGCKGILPFNLFFG
jgi:hypothetical protein